MRFEWDAAKNASNAKKHGVDFEIAQLIFDDPLHVSLHDGVEDSEQRWHAIGMVENIIMLTVVHTHHEEGSEEVIRIISARRATAHERKLYAETNR